MRRILVCGSRDYADGDFILKTIKRFANRGDVIVHGDARGADSLAGAAARKLGLVEEPHPADWNGHGRAAGPKRNELMLKLGVDTVLAFKDGFDFSMKKGGTEHMVRISRKAGVPVYVYSDGEERTYWRLA